MKIYEINTANVDIPVSNGKTTMKFVSIQDFKESISEIINNLEDDLQLDFETGEEGYTTYQKSHCAVNKFTLKILKRIYEEIK